MMPLRAILLLVAMTIAHSVASILPLNSQGPDSLLHGDSHAHDWITASGSSSRSGYWPHFDLDPTAVGGPAFGQLFNTRLPAIDGNEPYQILANPLVFNSTVFVATSGNNVYAINSTSGDILNQRNIMLPFFTSDLADTWCADIRDAVGIVGTPVIDPNSSTMYFFAKSYAKGTKTPRTQSDARYYFHAIDTVSFEDRPGFPVDLEGIQAHNDKRKYFQGGTVLQRPALLQSGNGVFGAFGSHCDTGNYTGWVIGFETSTGNLLSAFVTNSDHQDLKAKDGSFGGGASGIWMSGNGIASDTTDSMFVVTGNGVNNRSSSPTAQGNIGQLSQSVIKLAIPQNSSHLITPNQFFRPHDTIYLDDGDIDFGSGGITIFPAGPSIFGSRRLAAVGGKGGVLYILDVENLGGMMMAAGGGDNVVQHIQLPESIYSSAAVYPEEGGYLYVVTANGQMHSFRFIESGENGTVFTEAGVSGFGVGFFAGSPIVTSVNGRPGSAIVWFIDYTNALHAVKAVPDEDGKMKRLFSGSPMKSMKRTAFDKWQRPAFSSDGVFVVSSDAVLYKFGIISPSPFESAFLDFGSVANGTSLTKEVELTAVNPVSVSSVDVTDPNFIVSTPSLDNLINPGDLFALNVTFAPATEGHYTATLKLNTAVGPSFVTLLGSSRTKAGKLTVESKMLNFGGSVTDGDAVVKTALIKNDGMEPYTIQNISTTMKSDSPFVILSSPNPGTVVSPGDISGIVVQFNSTIDGSFSDSIVIDTSVGSKTLLMTATSMGSPTMEIRVQQRDGSFAFDSNSVPSMDFGTLAMGHHPVTLNFTISNRGPSTLIIKEPLVALDNGDLSYDRQALYPGIKIAPDQSVSCAVTLAVTNTTLLGVQSHRIDGAIKLLTNDIGPDASNRSSFRIVGLEVYPPLPSPFDNWNYLGCNAQKTFTDLISTTSSTESVTDCLKACDASYTVAVLGSAQCWCTNTLPRAYASFPEQCATPDSASLYNRTAKRS